MNIYLDAYIKFLPFYVNMFLDIAIFQVLVI